MNEPLLETPNGRLTYVLDGADAESIFVCAHGAGGSYADRSLLAASRSLRDAGLGILRFNFPYRERGSGRPDPMPVLQECVRSALELARAVTSARRFIVGGRSMGGRAASMVAAEGVEADGLLLLAYPLHPPGQHTRLRDAHLASIRIPVLCCNGTRDTFCDRGLMEQVLQRLPASWTMHWLEGADHGFRVLKSSGRTDADVLAEVRDAARSWIASRSPGPAIAHSGRGPDAV